MSAEFRIDAIETKPPGPGERLFSYHLDGHLLAGSLRIGLTLSIPFADEERPCVITHIRPPEDDMAIIRETQGQGPLIVTIKMKPELHQLCIQGLPAAGTVVHTVSPFG